MNDIKNQINIITEDVDSAFSKIGLKSVETILRNAQRAFNVWSKLPDEERTIETTCNKCFMLTCTSSRLLLKFAI